MRSRRLRGSRARAGRLRGAARRASARPVLLLRLFTTEDGAYLAATAASRRGSPRSSRPTETEHGGAWRSSSATCASRRRTALPRHARNRAVGLSGGHEAPRHVLPRRCACSIRDGSFGVGAAARRRDRHVVPATDDERWLELRESAEPARAVAKALPFCGFTSPPGTCSSGAPRRYQVNALSLSADRSSSPIPGSAAEVGVLAVASREPVYEKRRKGGTGRAPISPDGARLFSDDRTDRSAHRSLWVRPSPS